MIVTASAGGLETATKRPSGLAATLCGPAGTRSRETRRHGRPRRTATASVRSSATNAIDVSAAAARALEARDPTVCAATLPLRAAATTSINRRPALPPAAAVRGPVTPSAWRTVLTKCQVLRTRGPTGLDDVSLSQARLARQAATTRASSTSRALSRDPACGMLIDPANAPASVEQDGTTLYFCSRGCRAEFLDELGTPAGYSEAPARKEAMQ